jgi:hypothetical protein
MADNETTPQSESQPSLPVSDRGPRGRFARGNKVSKGNAAARKMTRFRTKLFACVTLADFAEIVGVVVREAKAGEKWACELAFAYLCGPPVALDILEQLTELQAAVAKLTAEGGVS